MLGNSEVSVGVERMVTDIRGAGGGKTITQIHSGIHTDTYRYSHIHIQFHTHPSSHFHTLTLPHTMHSHTYVCARVRSCDVFAHTRIAVTHTLRSASPQCHWSFIITTAEGRLGEIDGGMKSRLRDVPEEFRKPCSTPEPQGVEAELGEGCPTSQG